MNGYHRRRPPRKHSATRVEEIKGRTSPTLSTRSMPYGLLNGGRRISSASSSATVNDTGNKADGLFTMASVKDVIDRLKKEVDLERSKRVSIAKQRSEDIFKLVLRSKAEQRTFASIIKSEAKSLQQLKDLNMKDSKGKLI
ncbi:hypothetical protein FBUS_04556 [Fasciolopsis buskii]|uniref:Uncharacterized protein n=1 Tax=Fasciolopsis buskii TaxID=27845 RepID=A0A8E0VRK5_9TREM|nr:hypothetical protein FBUS_04556 [Fasciolopsis buski]